MVTQPTGDCPDNVLSGVLYWVHSVQSWEWTPLSKVIKPPQNWFWMQILVVQKSYFWSPKTCFCSGRYFSKCIKHGSAIEGQIHSKSRKSWKSWQKLKAGRFGALPRIAHSPFITKLARSPCSLFNWRFNWNDRGVRSQSPAIVENAQSPISQATFWVGSLMFWSTYGFLVGIVNQWRDEMDPSQWACPHSL